MKNLVRTVLLGGAIVAATLATAGPASAECSNDAGQVLIGIPTICVFYDDCDADICIAKPIGN